MIFSEKRLSFTHKVHILDLNSLDSNFPPACCHGRLYLGGRRWQKITFQLLQYSHSLDNILQAYTMLSQSQLGQYSSSLDNALPAWTISSKHRQCSPSLDNVLPVRTIFLQLGQHPPNTDNALQILQCSSPFGQSNRWDKYPQMIVYTWQACVSRPGW